MTMSRPSRLSALCAACLVGVLAPRLIAQVDTVEWRVPVDVTPDDRKAILAIARAVGIHDPKAVSMPIRSGCLLVAVESRPVLQGNRVVSEILHVRQKNGPECRPFGADRRLQQAGNWVAALGTSNPRRNERWRIRDGTWHVDVYLSSDVPYDDAVMIVQAIRRKQLVDRRPLPQSSSPIRYIDANRISSIRRGFSPPDIPRQYEIMEGDGEGKAGGGEWLTVRIRDGRVELHKHGQWVA